MLVTQVILGFQYYTAFQEGFGRLPGPALAVHGVSSGLTLAALAFVMAPVSYHRIVARGEDSEEVHRVLTRFMGWAPLPLALSLSASLSLAAGAVWGWRAASAAFVTAACTSLYFWYGLDILRTQGKKPDMRDERKPTSLKDKCDHVLAEARMVLPGAQALLGFQFSVIFVKSFDALSDDARSAHLAGLALVAFSTILLMTPAIYHRLVEGGAATEHFHRFSSRVLLAAMGFLAAGLSVESYVFMRQLDAPPGASLATAGVLAALLAIAWGGPCLVARASGARE